ncbi:uncharacterized protein JCM15063_004790 [Sporobolomyces koalae]|uniref:uncharacterized protein n=1 Tax=Sporobolomyces koalae TaxID=500713 RepID=UPI003177072A
MSEQPSKGSQLLASGKELFNKLPKDLNALRQQTTPLLYRHEDTLKLQLYIRSQRGVTDSLSALSRNSQLASKNLFVWTQQDDQGADISDVFDRAAFLQYKSSEVHAEAAARIEQSRLFLKDIRNSENELSIRRKNRTALATKLQTLKDKDTRGKSSDQIATLQNELDQLDSEIVTSTSAFAALQRQKLHESFALRFAAEREMGEKLAIIASYGELLLQTMETDGIDAEYGGKRKTAQIKVELEQALAAWKPSPVPALPESSASSFQHSDTRSFGATHADQLSLLGDDESASSHPTNLVSPGRSRASSSATRQHFVPPLETIPATPGDPTVPGGEPHQRPVPPIPARSPFRDSMAERTPQQQQQQHLNLSPTPQDLGQGFSPPTFAEGYPVPHPPIGVSPPEPTIAETGAPQVGTGGPASGQLRPRSSISSTDQNLGPAQQQSPRQEPLFEHDRSGSMPGALPLDEAGWDGIDSSRASTGAAGGGGSERLPGYGEGDEDANRANEEAERILALERESKQSSAGRA